MLKHKKSIRWLLIAGAILVCNGLLFDVAVKNSVDYIEIPVAAVLITPRTKISESHIRMERVPSAMVSDSIHKSIDDIVDLWVKYSVTLAPGSFFYHEYVEVAENVGDHPQLMLEHGQGVASLAVDLLTSAGNTLLPGQYVDIVFTSKDKRKPIVSDVIFRSVRVLAVKDRNGLDMSDPKSQKIPAVALLALNQQDIPLFLHAQIFGDIDLIIRLTNDFHPLQAIKQTESDVWRLLNE